MPSDSLTDEHHDFVQSLLGVDPRSYPAKDAESGPDLSQQMAGDAEQERTLRMQMMQDAQTTIFEVQQDVTDIGAQMTKKVDEDWENSH